MGFSALVRGGIAYYGESHYGQDGQDFRTKPDAKIQQFLKKEIIMHTALDIFERLGTVFALVVACYYSLTGDFLSNDEQMYVLLGAAALSNTIDGALGIAQTGLKLTQTLPDPSDSDSDYSSRENYVIVEGNRTDQINNRLHFFFAISAVMITLSVLFATILSCHYFRMDNFLSNDTLAYLLMGASVGYIAISTLMHLIMMMGHNVVAIDSINMKMGRPLPPEKLAEI